MSAALSALDPRFRPWASALVDVAEAYRLRPRLTSTRRSLAEQTRLYRKWLAGEHPYPVAPPGRSQHNYGLAVDLVCDDPAWLGAVWQAWGGTWGGRNDPVHFGTRL